MTNGYEQPYKVFKTVFGEIKYNVVGSGLPKKAEKHGLKCSSKRVSIKGNR